MKKSEAMSYREKENVCESKFASGGPYWHLYTDGGRQSILFTGDDDMKVAMNLFAVCTVRYPVLKFYTIQFMNNHLHLVVSGPEALVRGFFVEFKTRLQRCFLRDKRVYDMTDFDCELFEIDNLQTLRNEIVYVNRNGYLVRPDCTPYSYPWGSNAAFFNPVLKCVPVVSYDSLTVKQKRSICHSNDVNLGNPDLMVYDGMIQPSSYCCVSEAEQMFRDAHHYFYLLTRNFEAYCGIARRMHDSIFLTDEELYAAISVQSFKRFGVRQPSLLAGDARIEMARVMHNDYNASNRQIRSVLKISQEYVDELFPQSK